MHIGKALKDAGYASMFIGKYFNRNSSFSATEWQRHGDGWTYLDVIKASNGDYFDYTVHTKTGNVHYDEALDRDGGRARQASFQSDPR